MSLSKSENIFWKMIHDQKKHGPNKPPPQEVKPKQTNTKQIKKLNSTILDKIEVALNTSTQSYTSKRSSIKNKDLQELGKIEGLSTFNKIIKLQNLCKEMISAKERFGKNKTQMIQKINKNCENYYKNKVCMKEIYDFCRSKKPEEHIDYILIPQPEKYFSDKFSNIYNFLFMLRNNNKLMLKMTEYCNEANFEQMSDFIINFFYEDTINSSFIQEELMLFIYLIFEKNFFEILPEEIKIDDNKISYDIFRSKKNIIYYIVKSLTRKADIRNFLCSILVDDILKLEGNKKYLSPDIFSPKNLEEDDYKKNTDEETPIIFLKKYTISQNINTHMEIKLNSNEANNYSRSITRMENELNDNINNFDVNHNKEEKEKDNSIDFNSIKEEKENESNQKINDVENNVFDPFLLLQTSSSYDIGKITLDPFFEKNNTVSEFINKKLSEFTHYSKTNPINLAMIDYLNSLLKDIEDNKKENKNEIYSNSNLIKVLKIIKIKEEKDLENKKSFNTTIEIIKTNYNLIVEIINDMLEKLDENITSVPFTIKCISNIIEQLLSNKYFKKTKNVLSLYQKFIFKSNFFIGNILLSSIIDRDYNGIITSEVTSKITTENLKIIYDIFDKLLSGKLFRNDSREYFFYTLFNKLIIKTVPKIFNIIDKIEKKFKLPDIMQRLINTCKDKNNTKRLNDFEYDYFFEKNEIIRYQSLCFNFDTLLIFIKLAQKILDNLNDFSEEESCIIARVYGYEKFISDLNQKNKIKEKKLNFIYLSKISFKSPTEKRINSILKDNFITPNSPQNENGINFIKKCLIEVLEYANAINKFNFIFYIQNLKRKINNHDINNIIFMKNRLAKFEQIINGKNITNEINERELTEKNLNFEKVLFQNILDFLKLEIDTNYNDLKTQRIVFCALYVQTNLKFIPDDYKENNYSKLIMELIKEALEKLNYLNSNILNQLSNKIKEGNKLNLIITSNYLQAKSLEKFKCIEYLYYKSLLPFNFKIEKDENDIIKKVEFVDNEKNESKEENKKCKDKLFPNFRNYEGKIDDIIQLEEDCLMADALKEYFQKLKKVVRAEKIIKRFSKEEIDSIIIELENHILYKLYDKLYPLKPSKLDEKFYKKCCRLSFIKPTNIITDKNIYNEQLWKFSIDYLNEINNKYTPQDKLKVVLKAFGILQNSITFSSGKKELGVDDTIKPLIFILIQSQPKNIFTNYNYCQLFLNGSLSKTQYGILLTQLYMIMNIIKDMKYTDLIDVTEDKFGKDDDE